MLACFARQHCVVFPRMIRTEAQSPLGLLYKDSCKAYQATGLPSSPSFCLRSQDLVAVCLL